MCNTCLSVRDVIIMCRSAMDLRQLILSIGRKIHNEQEIKIEYENNFLRNSTGLNSLQNITSYAKNYVEVGKLRNLS